VVSRDVVIEIDDETITAVTIGAAPPSDARRLGGLVIPGLANVHSHAFHRALRGRTEAGSGDFWSWREQMYATAATLDPDSYHRLARATYAEMTLAGITTVGEFHYLHHRPDGSPYEDPNVMSDALVAAAGDAGMRITLIDTCYLRGGPDGRPLEGTQRRFGDGSAERWAARASRLRDAPHLRRAAGIHSVRAVDPASMETVAAWAAEHDAPLHVHVSEQPQENADCLAATGRTPTLLLADHGVLGERTTAVHATHMDDDDIAAMGGSRTTVCLCPTTERSLADGVGPAGHLRRAGSPLCVGSDSHAMIDLFEEARAVELNERLVTGRRGVHRPEHLLEAMTSQGMAALGWTAGRIAVGSRADLVAIDLDSPRLAGAHPDDLAAHAVFAATASDVTDVIIDGRSIVEDRKHLLVGDVGAALAASMEETA
jgi:formiminoglutamate deiminase